MRLDLIKEANWKKLLKLIIEESTKEEEVVRLYMDKWVKNCTATLEKHGCHMRAHPEQVKKVVTFLKRIRQSIQGDVAMEDAWKAKLT